MATKKTAAKKVIVKKAATRAPAPKTNLIGTKGAFALEFRFNDLVLKGKTDSPAAAIQAIKPDVLKTAFVVKAKLTKKGAKKIADFVYMVPFARRMFVNAVAAGVFEKRVKMALGYDGE